MLERQIDVAESDMDQRAVECRHVLGRFARRQLGEQVPRFRIAPGSAERVTEHAEDDAASAGLRQRDAKFADRIVVSIEDPVEYEVPGITQVQLDEKHHLSFAEGVKAMLRLDPDFLMIGEIRDAASADAAVNAAITGRVLLSTVHARDAVGTVTALRNWGLPDHEIAESLAVVVAQRLVRRLCPECRKAAPLTDNEMRWLGSFQLPAPKRAWSAVGCNKCNGLGYLGRTGIFELWRLRQEDYRLILDHSDEHTLRKHFHKSQGESLLADGLAKIDAGVTSLAELRKASSGAFASHSLDKTFNGNPG